AFAGLGVVMLAGGRIDDAVEAFRKAVAIRPGHGEAQANLAAALGGALGDDEVATLKEQLADKRIPEADRMKLHFALAEILDAKGDAEAAFAEYAAGNALRKSRLVRGGRAFDADAYDRMIDRVIAAYDRRWFDRHRKTKGVSTDQPVFIVGMPRSGTTLVEQIAASHPKVAGRGEIDLIRVLAGADPAAAAGLDEARLKAMAATYLDRLRMDADKAIRITDKTPFNFLHLGLIQVLFPNARAVHCVRDPLDTGFSCWRQNFAATHAWACDLADIGRTMRAYRRLMDHWRRELKLPMLEVRYEDLIDNQKKTSRGLIGFLDLPWDDACLKFHKSGRAVLTASNWQVRKPLYDTAVGRAKRYDKFLAPLKQALAG
ncbi:MAG: sulfotransferase, partial [Rhodospirillales bacterium]